MSSNYFRYYYATLKKMMIDQLFTHLNASYPASTNRFEFSYFLLLVLSIIDHLPNFSISFHFLLLCLIHFLIYFSIFLLLLIFIQLVKATKTTLRSYFSNQILIIIDLHSILSNFKVINLALPSKI